MDFDELYRASKPKIPNTPQEIFLFHGFLGDKCSHYSAIIEGWASNMAETASTPIDAYVFRFVGPSIPEGGAIAVEKIVDKSRGFINYLPQMKGSEQEEYDNTTSPQPDNAPPAQRTTEAIKKVQESKNTIVFIAHGVGCWVARKVLGLLKSGGMAPLYERAELIFLDPKGEGSYPEYLNQTWTLFNPDLPMPESIMTQCQGFSKYLQSIDEKVFDGQIRVLIGSNDDEEDTSNRGISRKYREQNLKFWMPGGKLTKAGEEEPLEEIIRKLPTFREVMLHSTSHPTAP